MCCKATAGITSSSAAEASIRPCFPVRSRATALFTWRLTSLSCRMRLRRLRCTTSQSGTVSVAAIPISSGIAGSDTTSGHPLDASPTAYTGPVNGLFAEYVNVTNDNLSLAAGIDNVFLHTGSGTDAIAVRGGSNVLDGGTGSNFLTGGSGTDTFYVDDRGANASIWSTVVGFHKGDAATVWGVSPGDFALDWADNQESAGFTGLTLHASAPNQPIASLILAGFSQADLANGRLAVSFSIPASPSAHSMSIRRWPFTTTCSTP